MADIVFLLKKNNKIKKIKNSVYVSTINTRLIELYIPFSIFYFPLSNILPQSLNLRQILGFSMLFIPLWVTTWKIIKPILVSHIGNSLVFNSWLFFVHCQGKFSWTKNKEKFCYFSHLYSKFRNYSMNIVLFSIL